MSRTPTAARVIDRYALYGEIASGGMATVHFGRLRGTAGFTRTVAIKRLLPHLANNPEFSAMVLDEARLTARIRHPNVVSVLDVVASDDELLLVMDYVHGESLARLLAAARRTDRALPLPVISAILSSALHGVHAAHVAIGDDGEPLAIVHRDFTPQNILVGEDGVARVVDFGVARAIGRQQTTREGQLKGKPAYMSPEQVMSEAVDARTDVFAAGVVLWEALTLRRLFQADSDTAAINKVLNAPIDPPSRINPSVPKAFDAIALHALERAPERRYPSAQEMALAIEEACPPAPASKVGEWVKSLAGEVLARRADAVSNVESASNMVPVVAEKSLPATTTTNHHQRGRERRTGSRVVVALALLALGGLAGWAITSWRLWSPRSTPPSVTSENVPVAATPPPVVSSVTTPATPAPPPAISAPAIPTAKAAPVRVALPKPPPRPNCSPPYTIDEKGIQRWKKECVK